MKRRYALILALAIAAFFVCVREASASDDPYNSNWFICGQLNQSLTGPMDPYWWWYECWKPDPPDHAQVAG